MNPLKNGQQLELSIESLALGGKGVAHLNDLIIFVERSLPGQIVTVQIIKKKKRYAIARLISVVNQSPHAISAPCPHFGMCGGCLHQNLEYTKQIEYKRDQIIETLQHIGGFEDLPVEETIPSPDIYGYRNKMEFSFSDKRWLTDDEIHSQEILTDKNFALGLHVPGRFDKVLDLQACLLQSSLCNEIYKATKKWCLQSQLFPYAVADHTGFWRFFVLRESKNTDQLMVNIITANCPQHFENIHNLCQMLTTTFPALTTVIHNINKKKAQIAVGDEEHILYGDGYIQERLGPYTFQISANSFFQTNSKQAEQLYQKIIEWGQFSSNDIIYDLYCGTGSIAIFVSRYVNRVIGFELVPNAIADAQKNCHLNAIENCVFIEGDLKDKLSNPHDIVIKYGKPDTIIIDPPRSGMHPSLPHKIIEISPGKIIYISCNPATCARDLKILCETHYTILKVQPIDMFPHTPHCEIIAFLVRNE